jgi:hypothetical protein
MAKAMDVVEALEAAAGRGDPVPLGAVNDEIGHRGTGALIAAPAMLEITPIGGIPGVPTVLAAIIALLAAQIAIGRRDIWLPDLLERRTVHARRLDEAAGKLRPLAGWLDRHFGGRLPWFTQRARQRLAACAVLAMAALVPPLELIPFASTIPMAVIALFGLGLLLRDGVVIALAWAGFAAAAVALWVIVPI